MPYLDGHDRRLLKELRPERTVHVAPLTPRIQRACNFIAFVGTVIALILWGG